MRLLSRMPSRSYRHARNTSSVPAWVEAVVPRGEVMDIRDSKGNVPTDENADEDFPRLGVRVATPHWVFV